MRPLYLLSLLSSCLLTCGLPLVATAQESNVPPPPRLEKLDENEDAAITVSKPDTEKKITQQRSQGKVTEVRVKSGKRSYVVKPNTPAGSSLPGDAQSNAMRPPQWEVKQFSATPKKEDATTSPETAIPVSPPPSN